MRGIILLSTLMIVVFAAIRVEAAELTGRVTRPDGRPVAGATMTIGTYNVNTNAQGRYKFGHLRPGQYVLTVGIARKRSKSFRVTVKSAGPNKHDIVVRW